MELHFSVDLEKRQQIHSEQALVQLKKWQIYWKKLKQQEQDLMYPDVGRRYTLFEKSMEVPKIFSSWKTNTYYTWERNIFKSIVHEGKNLS